VSDHRRNPDNPYEMTNRQELPRSQGQEPLDGSKKVKNRNHSRQKQHTEG